MLRLGGWQVQLSVYCVAVGPGYVSISPAFMRSSASHPADPHDSLAKKVNLAHIAWVGCIAQFAQQFSKTDATISVSFCLGM